MIKTSLHNLKFTKKHRSFLLFILFIPIFNFQLLSQNYLPEERKGDWLNAGYLRFLDKNLTISKKNNVLDYGAINDGTVQDTNNQKAIMAAIEDKDTNGRTLIYFPAGTYKITYRIRINKEKNIILRGDGSNETRLIFDHANANLQPNIYIRNSENIGIENMHIERADNAEHGDNIRIKYSKNCWVSGVESYKAISNHIYIARSKNIEIRGCHIHHAWDYGTGGHGYGVCLGDTVTEKCLIEDNIFNHLRHSVILSNGPTSNVIGYNYSTDPYTTETYLRISDWPSDMCLHGHPSDLPGPSRNLFEGNICAFMHADGAWDDNGPYNTYFRNRATYYGLKIHRKSPDQNIIANEVDDSDGDLWDFLWNAFKIRSSGNYVVGNINFDPNPDVFPSPSDYSSDLSLYFDPDSIPEFLSSVEYWPPIGIVDSAHMGGGSNPAKNRWDDGGILTVSHPEHELVVEEMSIDSLTGLISWTPGAEDFGTNDITVQVYDNNSTKDEQRFTVSVDSSARIFQKSNQLQSDQKKKTFTNDIILAVAPNIVCLNQNRGDVLFGTSYQGKATAFLSIYDRVEKVVFKDEFQLEGNVFSKAIKVFGTWNLRNKSGRQIIPGTYLAVLKIIDFSGNTKHVLKSKIGVSDSCK